MLQNRVVKVQLIRHGWTYVLHDDADLVMATEIKLALNRLGYPIWSRERDAPDQTDWNAHRVGVERAAFVVVLETARLRRNSLARELVKWAESWPVIRPGMITLKVEPGERIASSGSEIPMRRSLRLTVGSLHLAMQRRKHRVNPPAAPEGRRGRYVVLSYASPDADKAAEVRHGLAQLDIQVWDYAVAPRDATMRFEDEIRTAIERSRAVLIILTAAWLKSEHCLGEIDHANRLGRFCLWLRFGPGTPPIDHEQERLIEFRGRNRRGNGFTEVAHWLRASK